MIKNKRILPVAAGAVLAIILTVSILMYKINDSKWHPYVLFFPQFTNPEKVDGEVRKIRLNDNYETNIENLVRELMLGSADLRYISIIPKDTVINTIMVRDNILYIDFSPALFFSENDHPLTLSERLQLFSRSIIWNFSDLEEIIYTINGEVPVDF